MLKKLTLPMMMFAALNFGQVALAEEDPIKTMANIMVHLEHYPSDSEKKMLMGISKSGSASMNSKTLAGAMINLEHKVNSADKPKLDAIVNDAKASENEKTLAKIILSLNHKPSDADKDSLNQMIK